MHLLKFEIGFLYANVYPIYLFTLLTSAYKRFLYFPSQILIRLILFSLFLSLGPRTVFISVSQTNRFWIVVCRAIRRGLFQNPLPAFLIFYVLIYVLWLMFSGEYQRDK